MSEIHLGPKSIQLSPEELSKQSFHRNLNRVANGEVGRFVQPTYSEKADKVAQILNVDPREVAGFLGEEVDDSF